MPLFFHSTGVFYANKIWCMTKPKNILPICLERNNHFSQLNISSDKIYKDKPFTYVDILALLVPKTALYGALYYCDHFFFSYSQSPPVSILVYMLLIICGWDLAYWLESVWQPMPKSQLSWVRSQHPTTQWNLRGGRWSSFVE